MRHNAGQTTKRMSAFTVVSFDFPKMLAHLTGTRAKSWREAHGPETGCGMDYYYDGPQGREAYINVDQENATISVDGETIFSGDIQEDTALKKHVRSS